MLFFWTFCSSENPKKSIIIFYFIFDQINAALLSIREINLTHPKHLNALGWSSLIICLWDLFEMPQAQSQFDEKVVRRRKRERGYKSESHNWFSPHLSWGWSEGHSISFSWWLTIAQDQIKYNKFYMEGGGMQMIHRADWNGLFFHFLHAAQWKDSSGSSCRCWDLALQRH